MEEQAYEQEPTTLVWIQPDFSTFCRVCANSNDYLIPIFKGEGLENQLKIKIERHLPMKICEDDALPTQVCYQCASTLLAWHELVENCLNAEKRLQNLLEQQNNKIQESLKADNENDTNFLDEQLGIITDGEDIDENIAPSASINDFQDSYCSDTDKLKQPVKKRLRVTTQKKNQEMCEAIPKEEPPTENREESFYNSGLCQDEDEKDIRKFITHSKGTIKKSDKDLFFKQPRIRRKRVAVCNECGKSVNANNLKVHLLSHSSTRLFVCEICGASFKRKGHVQAHKERVHDNIEIPPRPMPCEVCGEILNTYTAFYRHKHKHTMSFVCDKCGKCFAMKSQLKVHEVKHSDDRPFKCETCGKGFPLKARLKIHQIQHSNERPFSCGKCEKSFKTRNALQIHDKTHLDIRPYACPHCDKKCRKQQHLSAHIRTHTGEKPYQCDVCGRAFAQSGDMRKHKNTHN